MNVDDLYRLLRTGHAQMQAIVDTVSDPLLVLDGSLCVENASRSFFETFKVDRYETIGKHVYELGDGQWDIPALRVLLEKVIPRSAAVINYEVETFFPNLGKKTMRVTARTLFNPDNTSRSMLLSFVDASEVKARDLAKELLFGELRHRMKNLLAVTQAIARQGETAGRTAEEYREAFLGRFNALVEAEDLAFGEHDEIDLALLIERMTAPFKGNHGEVVVEPGAPTILTPRTTLSLSLVLHELVTNAAKHGALSRAGGQVRVSWEVEEAERKLRLRWVESGGPPPPAAAGYGTRLIQSAVTYNLGGKLEQKFAAGGLETEIVFPLGASSPPA